MGGLTYTAWAMLYSCKTSLCSQRQHWNQKNGKTTCDCVALLLHVTGSADHMSEFSVPCGFNNSAVQLQAHSTGRLWLCYLWPSLWLHALWTFLLPFWEQVCSLTEK